jgi:tetratricopeptide (TPR) repeat protein
MRRIAWLVLLALLQIGCKAAAPQAVQLDDISPTRLDRRKDAIEEFESNRNDLEFHAALDLWEQGEAAACQERLAAILARQPGHTPAALLLAETKLAARQPSEAAELLKGIVKVTPQDEHCRRDAAVLALRYNESQLAVDLLQTAPAPQSPSPALLRTRGVAHYRCGDYAAAEAALEQALVLDNRSALAYFLMGCTQSRLGQKSRADAAFEQAARLDARFGNPR